MNCLFLWIALFCSFPFFYFEYIYYYICTRKFAHENIYIYIYALVRTCYIYIFIYVCDSYVNYVPVLTTWINTISVEYPPSLWTTTRANLLTLLWPSQRAPPICVGRRLCWLLRIASQLHYACLASCGVKAIMEMCVCFWLFTSSPITYNKNECRNIFSPHQQTKENSLVQNAGESDHR